MALALKWVLTIAVLVWSQSGFTGGSVDVRNSVQEAFLPATGVATSLATDRTVSSAKLTDVAKATTLVTLIDVRAGLCLQKYPLEAKNLGFDFSAADIAAGLYIVLDVSVKCFSNSFPVYTGSLLGTELTVAIYAVDSPAGLAFCRRGLVENCTLGIASTNSYTVISAANDQCYEAVSTTALPAYEGNPAYAIYQPGVTCKSLGMEILVGYLAGTRLRVPVYTSSESTGRILCNNGAVENCALSSTPPPTAQLVVVREFYNAALNRYFRTANSNEIAFLNANPTSGESQTGDTFQGFANEVTRSVPVCRFYGSVNPGPNSHFYTSDRGECAAVRAQQLTTPISQKRWNYEGVAFFAFEPSAGVCPPGASTPVYRAYNRGNVTGRDSNHRLTSNLANYNAMIAQGWSGEGVVMCTP
jgi:Repeat of unknown function (DUF5648)